MGHAQLVQPSRADLAETLGHENRLEQCLPVVGMGSSPAVQRLQGGGAAAAQFEADVLADKVLAVGEEIQQGGEFGSLDFWPFGSQRAGGVVDTPDAALHVVPTHVAHRVLGMTDDGTGEVGDIESPVHPELHVHGSEGRILGGNQVEASVAADHALAEVEPGERHHVRPDAGGGGHALLVFVGEVRARDAGGGAALAVAHGLGMGEGMVNA